MMTNILKSKKGTSLLEVMVAVFISAIVMLGGSFFYVASTSQIHLRKQYRAACRLAGQKLEELKAGNYDAITIGEAKDSISLEESSSYSRSVVTEEDLSRTQLKVRWLPLTEILRNFYFHGNRFFFIKFIEGSFQDPQLLIA
ncbi:MAG TPA: prepilin-type N-terminal cleavage/methylation domain-containing protein, partial [Sedimentisphaerales bacterium]|nr:prepilin-type N-terminal cleavage/methylation domain-containing protein [Sedimentisphaerales bacterium]